jgi:murein DD-endopeptidase MepM/ murein hydrolase activator NlpD
MILFDKKLIKYVFEFRNIFFVFVISVLVISSTLFGAKTADASIVSLVNSLVGGESASAKSNPPVVMNSQNMPILQAAVNLDPNPNKPADSLPIQGNVLTAEALSSSNIDEADYNTSISTYIVREGDSLSSIAKMFNVSISTIVWANDLGGSKSVLRVGQTLIILPVSGVKYTVSKGDTISSITKKYKADIEEVLRYNDITINTKLVSGQTIIIPDAEISVASKISSGSSSGFPAYSGYYIRPIIGGYRSQGLHGHNGVDLAAPIGTPIRASADGIVIISLADGGWHGGYGNYIVVSHPNGTQTLYAHIIKSATRVGAKVEQGETIGYVGSTGRSTGPHLHFEIRGARNPF